MQEEIYQAVWCQVFAQSWGATEGQSLEVRHDRAEMSADKAARCAVESWDESKRHAAIVAKNKEQS